MIAAGIGIGVMPVKVIAPYVDGGAIVPVATVPALEAGRVFVSYRAGVPTAAVEPAIRVLDRVLQTIGYFAPCSSTAR